MDVKELFHFDPINLGAMVVIAIGAWATMRNTIAWHTKWITKHDKECDELRKEQSRILSAVQATNSHLATMAENQEKRLDRVEHYVDNVRI